jgi:polyphosphate:AMP phosphotransferase
MFEAVETGSRLSKEEFEKLEAELRVELITLQQRLRTADFAMVVVLTGDDRAGVNEAANLLHAWMDPRGIETAAFGPPSEEERERPAMWRFWRALPSRGRTALFLRSGLTGALGDRLASRIDDPRFDMLVDRYAAFERTLVADGLLLVKFWLHLPQAELRKRVASGEKARWPLLFDEDDLRLHRHYKRGLATIEHMLSRTAEAAAWHLVESTDRRHRDAQVARTIAAALRQRLDGTTPAPVPLVPPPPVVDGRELLDAVDLTVRLDKPDYEKQLRRRQIKVHRLSDRARAEGVSSVLVFEGWDAAGKGGCIRRLTAAMEAENYRVVPVAAPTDEERARHYLWRFWRNLPRAGHVTIFDRSWYGRVLVERVEGFASEAEWRRAYGEINDFEAQLCDRGVVVMKYWLHLDKDEQLRRFTEREQTPFKRYKITEEDWRNRERWDAYEEALVEMFARTSTPHAPWHLIAANDQRYARVDVLRLFAKRLNKAL